MNTVVYRSPTRKTTVDWYLVAAEIGRVLSLVTVRTVSISAAVNGAVVRVYAIHIRRHAVGRSVTREI